MSDLQPNTNLHEDGTAAKTVTRISLNPFQVLRHGDYKFVWPTEALSLWAMEMEIIVLAIFILRDTNSPLLVGLIGAAKFAGTLFGPIYGLIVDRFNRKLLQVGVRAFSVLLAISLTTLIITDALELWHAYAIVTAGSMVRMLDLILIQTLTADAVPSYALHGAIGLSRSTLDGARVVGSIAGGTVLELLGLDWAYITITVLYLLATITAIKIDSRPVREETETTSIWSGLREGLNYIKQNPLLPGLIFFSFLIEFTAFPLVNGLMAVIGSDLYDQNGTGIGFLAAIASAGALSGATLLGIKQSVIHPGRIMILGSITWHALMLLLATTPPLWLFTALLLLWGFSGGITFVAMVVALLRTTPPKTRGRVMGIRSLGIYGLSLGLLFGGWVSQEAGPATMIGILGGFGLTATLIAMIKWPALFRTE
ncbi:MAG: MFS transporter [SAR202 cluster bacterium]|nr:MFS transporter [SAR202 cluster bacterium]|tara:strand:- start:1784 stop:3058 length:1275 start_codon:yes stop_codon:yes gene_type:complete